MPSVPTTPTASTSVPASWWQTVRRCHYVSGIGQPVLLNSRVKTGLASTELVEKQTLATQQIAAVAVGHGEWVAVNAVAGLELAL